MGQVLLHLVRHGRPQIQPGRAASTWPLDPAADVEAMERLRDVLADRAPTAEWYSSDEPKAVATARRLTAGPVPALPALREAHRPDWFATAEEF
jgi:broad specificity phosphatase PhoE